MIMWRSYLNALALALLVLLVSTSLMAAQETDKALPTAVPQPQQSEADASESMPLENDQAENGQAEPEVLEGDTGALPPFPPRSQFDEMLERPLFTSSRRPQAGESSGGSAQELRETWKLTGIVLVGDEVRALFKERNGERRLRLGTGMPLDANWVLEEINRETVVMGSGDEQVTLELLEPRDSTPVAVPEQATPARADSEAAPLDDRTREASRQLEQEAESVKETTQ
ncbi:hypothetical protein [Marinobacterium sedimentorum]|uniref:hypothetical protein n=1 Tax=Marinobacterium sedimentorum TaxID=2927804 RepID=UPI0020C5C328|nr:hypothetical protein [Marinobacterium sedimentorum]MCP8687236.1 hypothetical protein [Marinobacterium sedimentorum]